MSKTIICRCEDITLDEILEVMQQGMTDIESIKRYLGVGTGPCQAKNCMVETTKILIENEHLKPDEAKPIVSRPPIFMTPLKFFAKPDGGDK